MGIVYEKKPNQDMTHFSVVRSCTIGDTPYRPSVCYPIPTGIESTIENMEKKGMAKRYAQEMRFVSGVARPVRS